MTNYRRCPIPKILSLEGLGVFFRHMDLELEAFIAIVKVKKLHLELDLKEYEFAMQFATPEMEAFDKLLNIIENLYKEIKFLEAKLNEV